MKKVSIIISLLAVFLLTSCDLFESSDGSEKENYVIDLGVVDMVSLGDAHSSALTSSGHMFTWGYNYYGQLGDGTQTDKTVPVDITDNFNLYSGETIIEISLGNYHSAAITSTYRIFTWGKNEFGQLGDGTTANRISPSDITDQFSLDVDENVISLKLGFSHSLALTSNGRIFSWGSNANGELGDGTLTDKVDPTDITEEFDLISGEKISEISIGYNHSAALTSEGRLFMWGSNREGQVGVGPTSTGVTFFVYNSPVDITDRFSINSEDKITNVNLGFQYSSALTSSGQIFTWGNNEFGQLGDGTITQKDVPTEISNKFYLFGEEDIILTSLGAKHSAALTSNGRIFAWGLNYDGQLCDGTYVDKNIPTEVTNHFVLEINEIIVDINLGSYHSSALTSNGRLFLWGQNYDGQLGNGSTTSFEIRDN